MQKNACKKLRTGLHHVHHECTTVQVHPCAIRIVAPHRTTTLWGWCSGATVRGFGAVNPSKTTCSRFPQKGAPWPICKPRAAAFS